MSALPPNWKRYTTPEGKEYFHNDALGTTQWEPPAWPDSKGATESGPESASEVYQYKPGSDLELKEASATTGAASVFDTEQTVSMKDEGTVSPSGLLPTTEAETVSLGTTQNTQMTGFGSAFGTAVNAATADDGGAAASGLADKALAYAQQLFDVSTDDVVKRLRLALLPYPPQAETVQNDFRQRPDFWGPFWVATTAVFFLAATGNFARLLEEDTGAFKADYGLVSIAACMIYGALVAVPVVARVSLYISGQDVDSINFRQMICVYGYSLAPAVPGSILCLIPVSFFRWLIVAIALGISLFFIRANLWTDISVEAPSLKWTMTALVVIAQSTIFLVYKMKFLAID